MSQQQNVPFAWPVDAGGFPMAIVTGHVTDIVKTAEFCAVHMSSTIMRPVPNGGETSIINAAREVQRDCEYVVGVERRLLDMQLGKLETVNPAHPVTGERFAGAPTGYDPATMPPHPGDAAPSVVAPASSIPVVG